MASRKGTTWSVFLSVVAILAFVSCLVTTRAGGSKGRLVVGLETMALTLGGTVAASALVASVFFRGKAIWWISLTALASFYASSWVITSYHSNLGDAALMAMACLYVGLGVMIGCAIGEGIRTVRTKLSAQPGRPSLDG